MMYIALLFILTIVPCGRLGWESVCVTGLSRPTSRTSWESGNLNLVLLDPRSTPPSLHCWRSVFVPRSALEEEWDGVVWGFIGDWEVKPPFTFRKREMCVLFFHAQFFTHRPVHQVSFPFLPGPPRHSQWSGTPVCPGLLHSWIPPKARLWQGALPQHVAGVAYDLISGAAKSWVVPSGMISQLVEGQQGITG